MSYVRWRVEFERAETEKYLAPGARTRTVHASHDYAVTEPEAIAAARQKQCLTIPEWIPVSAELIR